MSEHPTGSPAPPALLEVEGRMRPGRFLPEGYLGAEESLSDRLAEDAAILRSRGTSCAQVGAALAALVASAGTGKRTRRAGDGLDVRVESYKGFQMCPWSPTPHARQCAAGLGVQFASLDWHIRNRRTGETLSGPGLLVHFIRDHGFFAGVESPYRIAPDALVRLLELAPR